MRSKLFGWLTIFPLLVGIPTTLWATFNDVFTIISTPTESSPVSKQSVDPDTVANVGIFYQNNANGIDTLYCRQGKTKTPVRANSVNLSVKDYGATGNGITDDTAAIQAAIDAAHGGAGAVIYFPPGKYRIARTLGTNDHWGIKVTQSNVVLKGEGATLCRYNTDISTYAKSYPILFVGTPDSNVAAATQDVVVEGITFLGEDVRHAIIGSYLNDFRNAIVAKNTKGLVVKDCRFTKIDSTAIYFQDPFMYDYMNSARYNLTKNYNAKITGNSFIAEPHAVAGRALIHTIVLQGVDDCIVSNNYFEWCDDCVAGEGTYDGLGDVETDSYAPGDAGWNLGNVKRTGRGWIFSDNTILNSSEHAAYLAGMDVVVKGNTIRTDAPTICGGDIKIRSRNVSVVGNTIISGVGAAIVIAPPSFNVSVSGNVIFSNATDFSGGTIEIASVGLSTYIDNRPCFKGSYHPMSNIVIDGNAINLIEAAQTYGYGMRVYTDISNVNYPQGQIQNLNITNNTFRNHRVGVQVINTLFRALNVSGNIFWAKPFDNTGFDTTTVMNTRAIIGVQDNSKTALEHVKFDNNIVHGAKFLFATDSTGGTSVDIPNVTGNKLDYIQTFATSDMKALSAHNQFTGDVKGQQK